MAQSPFPIQPALPAEVQRVFQPLCEVISLAEIDRLYTEVFAYSARIANRLDRNEFTDVALAEEIVEVLLYLFTEYAALPSAAQGLIVGAARYFVLPHDAEPDGSLLGFEDDVLVLNYVVDQLGHANLKIEF